jgi:hypothetical protein
MNYVGLLTIVLAMGVPGRAGPGKPPVGRCPLKDGRVALIYLKRPYNGCWFGESIEISAKDSMVRSVSDGEVQAIFKIEDFEAIMVRTSRFFYTYSNLHSCVVKKGQRVKVGDTIGFCKELPLEFAISDKNLRGHGPVWKLVDCTCTMVDYQFKDGLGDTSLEGRAFDKVFRIREVQKANRRIDSVTHHQHGISLMVGHRPTMKEPYFIIQAGFNGELRYETYYSFYVYTRNLVVKVADPETGAPISLTEWRKKGGG